MESIDGPLQETINYESCTHLNAVADDVKNSYHVLLAFYVTCIAEKTPKRKADDVVCRICKSKRNRKSKKIHVCESPCNGKKNKRIHACLECAFFGCFDLCQFGKENGFNSHMKAHAFENKHYFAMNINHGCVFCFQCNDYIYNETLEEILNAYQVEARRVNGSPCYLPYKPKVEEIGQLGKIIKISDESFFPLRGIINLGNKCYVNSVIQIFIHNPIMIDFFLSDKHKCEKKDSDFCLICEMFILFQDFYSGITIPYNPLNFFIKLQEFGSVTKTACLFEDILTYSTRDPCQIFEEILTGLLLSCQDTHEAFNCNCFIHKIFYGINKTFRECECEFKSSSLDYFTSISLNIMENNKSLKESLTRKITNLTDYKCPKCKKIGKTSSVSTTVKLPAVICFMKSWYYYKNKKRMEVESSFSFDEWIDMSSYLNSDDGKLSNGSKHTSNSYGIKNRYYLFGIIVHMPDKNQKDGHLIAYVKLKRDLWFEINDALVYERDLKHVLACPRPFLLFYYKQK